MFELASVDNNTFFVGIDKETGGLNDSRHINDNNIPLGSSGASHYAILQIAVIVYNNLFEEIGEPLDIVIYHSEEELQSRVGQWSKEQFKDTLLIQCPKSSFTLEMAENMIIDKMINSGISKDSTVYMLGNSIRLDYEFMSAQMPNLKSFFHHRLLDVSAFKVLFETLYGKEKSKFNKKSNHDALDDIRESFEELKFYVEKFIIPPKDIL